MTDKTFYLLILLGEIVFILGWAHSMLIIQRKENAAFRKKEADSKKRKEEFEKRTGQKIKVYTEPIVEDGSFWYRQ
jgi:hypothetical protein